MLIKIKSSQMLAGLLLLLLLALPAVPTARLPIEPSMKGSSSQSSSTQTIEPAVLIKEIKQNLAQTNEKLATLSVSEKVVSENIVKRSLYLKQL